MDNKNMTALVSCFSRAYHYKNNDLRIFSDSFAEKILSGEEYNGISMNMKNGIKFFNPDFQGTEDEALRWIVDNQLSPSVLGRSKFAEDELIKAIELGISQYLIFASGYDTFAYRNEEVLNKVTVFEIDRKEMIEDKKQRLVKANIDISKVNYVECDFSNKDWGKALKSSKYNSSKICFCSLLGISYYLTENEFENMIKEISEILSKGSFVVFDYPTVQGSKETRTNEELAKESNEKMKAKYSYEKIVELLKNHGFKICKNLDSLSMTNEYFSEYNEMHMNNKIFAPKGVDYCMAVKVTD